MVLWMLVASPQLLRKLRTAHLRMYTYVKCVVEVKKLPMSKSCSGVLVASGDVYDKLPGMMQLPPERLLYALVCESGGVPEDTPDWITRGLIWSPHITLNLGR